MRHQAPLRGHQHAVGAGFDHCGPGIAIGIDCRRSGGLGDGRRRGRMHDEKARLAGPQVAFAQGSGWFHRKSLAVGIGGGQCFVVRAHRAMVPLPGHHAQ
ncbi:hypothetical protein D3C71_1643390 [compost metagenome]